MEQVCSAVEVPHFHMWAWDRLDQSTHVRWDRCTEQDYSSHTNSD